MARPVNESVLRALVNMATEDGDPPDVLAVKGSPRWSGESMLDTEVGPVRVAPCVSVLAVKDELTHRNDTADEEALVILTDRDEEELGEEVLARVWRRRLLRLSRWEVAKSLFRVDRLDPALADARWLVDLLVDVAPPRGYPPPPSGMLEFNTAWRTFLRHGLRLDVDTPTLEDLLRWGETEDASAALARLPGDHLGEIADRLVEDAGPGASHVMRIVAEGRGRELVPLGLVADVLWGNFDPEDPAVLTARVRFEGPIRSKEISSRAARSWAEAATSLAREAARRDDERLGSWVAGAESLLDELNARDLAVGSDVLPWAFTKRLMRAGQVLAEVVDNPQPEGLDRLEGEVSLVGQHLHAQGGEGAERFERLKMATRLVRRWQAAASSDKQGFKEHVAEFVSDGAWVDAAREAIGHGETVSSLAEAYAALTSTIDEERARRDRGFANAFASWSKVAPTEPEPLLPIERVLEQVVAPVARQVPVLLLVLDGLSYPESTKLFGDIRGAGWVQKGPEGRQLPSVISAVPTVTSVSRTSLLSGELNVGGQDQERKEFENHPALRDAAGGERPRLFHKKDLKIERGRIAPEVRDTVLDPSVQVVGAVVNAVDDHLDKGAQLRLAEGLRALRPLRPLLEAAAEADRAVVIASDHGHVLEHGSTADVRPGASERWRSADDPPGDNEVEISGPRVLQGNGSIVAPAVESIRYIAAEKRGYHGGATPQEVLCPLTVITTGGVSLEGWDAIPDRKPAWWEKRSEAVEVPPLPDIESAEPAVDPEGQGILFTEEGRAVAPSVEVEGWVGELLESPVFEEQREAAGRQALDDESVATLLVVMDRMGGVAPPAVLADVTDLPPSRLRTKLEALRRMLNLDGYPVLTIEADGTARLNRDLLATQFEVNV